MSGSHSLCGEMGSGKGSLHWPFCAWYQPWLCTGLRVWFHPVCLGCERWTSCLFLHILKGKLSSIPNVCGSLELHVPSLSGLFTHSCFFILKFQNKWSAFWRYNVTRASAQTSLGGWRVVWAHPRLMCFKWYPAPTSGALSQTHLLSNTLALIDPRIQTLCVLSTFLFILEPKLSESTAVFCWLSSSCQNVCSDYQNMPNLSGAVGMRHIEIFQTNGLDE